MPIYAYKCASCGFAKDVLQKLSDAPLSQCPSCGAPAFQKQLTAAGFQLKGSGWYATDFKNGNKGAPAGGEEVSRADGEAGKEASADTSKKDGKTDGKSDAKADSKSESTPDAKSSAKSEAPPDSKSESRKADAPANRKPDATPPAGSGT